MLAPSLAAMPRLRTACSASGYPSPSTAAANHSISHSQVIRALPRKHALIPSPSVHRQPGTRLSGERAHWRMRLRAVAQLTR